MQMGEARPAVSPVDEASIEASERAITDFLMDFKAHYGAEKVHVLAHSMGNRGLLRALQRIAAQTLGRVQFSQIFLAAPDVDRDLFLDLARLYPDTPSALRCMPLMAICRCISPRSCTTRRAADTAYPTPWLSVLTRWPCRTLTSIWATRTAPRRRRCCLISTISCATTRLRRSGSGSHRRYMRAQLFGG